jgi:hypothetical protein
MTTVLIISCSSANPIQTNEGADLSTSKAGFTSNTGGVDWLWGYYQLEIGSDASYVELVPKRSPALETYGVHLNALKLLEGGPCTNCVNTSNVHMTPEGYVSIDISLTHPYDLPSYTGFDVKGIIMFPATQTVPDDELFELVWPGAYQGKYRYYSRAEKGDAELVNADGYLDFWSPRPEEWLDWTYGEVYDYPIFDYFEGKFSSGTDYGTWNPFINYWSNEVRHMFEAGKTVTRTFIIDPPSSGPIEAGYAVYAHWNEASVKPVTNPATDFPIDANSALPYVMEFIQDAPIDPDAPPVGEMGKNLRIRMKHWGVVSTEDYYLEFKNLMAKSTGAELSPHPNGQPDEYFPSFFAPYKCNDLPDWPSSYPFIFGVVADDPAFPGGLGSIATQIWIMDIEFEDFDGEW